MTRDDARNFSPARALAVLVLAGGLASACGSVDVPRMGRTAVDQELVVRALERAIGGVETRALLGRRVTLDLDGFTDDQKFARQFVTLQLRARGIQIVDEGGPADLQLRAFASVLGANQGETLIGLPALQIPVVSVPIPEIALFKWSRSRGHTELQLFAFDAGTGRLVERIPNSVGRSKYDRFTLLLVIGFTVSDLDEPLGPPAPPAEP